MIGEECIVGAEMVAKLPAGTQHNIKNTSETEGMDKNFSGLESVRMTRRDFLKLSGVSLGLALSPGKVVDFFDKWGAESDLSEAATSYIAKTPQEAAKVSEIILFTGASASNICGPLSVAIMLDWRLKDDLTIEVGDKAELSGIIPTDMWLASPGGESTNPSLFEHAFPTSKYESFRIKKNIGRVDFNDLDDAGELKPGDFMFLTGGSFTHFIVISRKDKQGRLYATSNIPSSVIGEFIIDEVMLWDPKIKTGFFRELVGGIGPEKATTGVDGFYLWRKKVKTDNTARDSVTERYRNWFVNRLREQKGGKWHIHIQELGGKELFEWRDGIGYHPASTIKVPIAISVMKNISERYKTEIKEKGLEEVLSKKGLGGRTFKQLLSSMLVESEEDATELCVSFVNENGSIDKSFEEIGLSETTYLPRRSSQRDLYKAWEELFLGESLSKESKAFVIRMLNEYTENDDKLLGTLKDDFDDIDIWNKRVAVVTSGLYTIQDTGIVRIGNRFFFIGIAGTSDKGSKATDAELEEFIEEICSMFDSYVKEIQRKRKDCWGREEIV